MSHHSNFLMCSSKDQQAHKILPDLTDQNKKFMCSFILIKARFM